MLLGGWTSIEARRSSQVRLKMLSGQFQRLTNFSNKLGTFDWIDDLFFTVGDSK